MGTVEHLGYGAGRISGDLGHLAPSPRPRPRPAYDQPRAREKPDRVRQVVRTFGELMITAGLVVLLFVVYEVYVTDWISAGKQRDATAALDDRWKSDEAQRTEHFDGLGEGDGFAKMYIPAFGADYAFTIVEGTSAASLEVGPGHYDDTAYPGAPGNFAVAGHRVGKGAPFNDIDLINSCDAIVVETHYNWYVYRMLPKADEKANWANVAANNPKCQGKGPNDKGVEVLGGPYAGVVGQHVVKPSNGSVVAPVPGLDELPPNIGQQSSLMTLTTCHPRFSDRERLIVHAVLVNQYQKDPAKPDLRPDELMEG